MPTEERFNSLIAALLAGEPTDTDKRAADAVIAARDKWLGNQPPTWIVIYDADTGREPVGAVAGRTTIRKTAGCSGGLDEMIDVLRKHATGGKRRAVVKLLYE